MPTLDELGIKDQEAETMTGVFVPAGTPKAIVDLLQKEIPRSSTRPTSRRGSWSSASCPKATRRRISPAYVKAEVAKWRRVIEVATSTKSRSTSSSRTRRGRDRGG